MIHVWSWGGEYVGYLKDNQLWTYSGKHIGRYVDGELYDRNGKYIGEIKNQNRIIVNKQKKHKLSHAFTPHARKVGYVKYVDYVGYVMYAGYENFPIASAL